MNESAFSRELRKSFEYYGSYAIKTVGGPFTMIGVPDLIICHGGLFIGIECKQIKEVPSRGTSLVWNNIFTESQLQHLERIEQAGGLAYGCINLAYKRPQLAVVFKLASIKIMKSCTLEDLEGLIIRPISGPTILTRGKAGLWNVLELLK